MRILIIICFLVITAETQARNEAKETLYWSKKKYPGIVDKPLSKSDRSRPDILASEKVYEVDWPENYRQGFTQAMEYGIKTGKKPALILLIENPKQMKYVERAEKIAEKVFVVIDGKNVKVEIIHEKSQGL